MKIIIIAAVLIAIVFYFIRDRWPIEIVIDQNGVRSLQGLSKHQAHLVEQFFDRDVTVDSKAKVCAKRGNSGRIFTKFSASIDAGTQQQIRNFLMHHL